MSKSLEKDEKMSTLSKCIYFAFFCWWSSMILAQQQPLTNTDPTSLDSNLAALFSLGLLPPSPTPQTTAFVFHADGTQIYSCKNGSLSFKEPKAILYDFQGNTIGHHFSSKDLNLRKVMIKTYYKLNLVLTFTNYFNSHLVSRQY